MMVGLSMALTIAICIAAFIWIYVRVGPLLSDFIPSDTSGTATPSASAGAAATPSAEASNLVAPPPTPTAPPPTPTPAWQATHRIAGDVNVNFRSGPSLSSDPLTSLPPGTELKFLGEQQQGGNATWMHFQIEDGTEGWIRSIDVESISP